MKKLVVLLLMVLIAGGACRRASSPSAPAAPSPAASPEQLNHLAGGATPPPQTKYFKGSIGSTLDLQMKLVRDGDNLTGSYFYQKVGTRITLRGTVDKNGNLTLEEFDPSGKQTGIFKGIWTVNSQDNLITLAGNWSKPPGEKGDDKKTAFSVHEEPINLTGDVELIAKQIKDSNKKLNYQISVQYPQFSGGAANPNFEKFNRAARAAVMKEVSEFKKSMQPEEGAGPPPEDSMGSDLSIGYDITLAQDDLVSVKFDVGSYFQGAAHPNSYSDVINYDLKNGKPIRLADLFKPGAKYLQAISAYCIADLKKQASEKGLFEDQIQEGAAPNAKNYQSWTISKKGLGINFDTYQVGAYAVGPQFVLVPYSALKDLIKPDGPIGQFAQ
jgi:hypothetical protein